MSIIQLSTPQKQVNLPRGFTLIELIVVISIVAVTSALALDKLFWYQGQAEKASMEYTASIIKSNLWLNAASLMMAERSSEVAALAERNPIDLLEQKPANYLGEVDSSKTAALQGGNWFYDHKQHQVIYVVGQRRDFKPDVADDYAIRYGMKLLYGEMETSKGKKVRYIAGVTLVPLSHYSWE